MASLMDLIMQQVSGRTPVTPTPERQQMFDVLSSYGATAPQAVQERQQMFDVLSSYGAGMPVSMPPSITAPTSRPPLPQVPMLVGAQMPTIPVPAAMPPMPSPRPSAPMPLPSAAPAPSVRQGFMQRLLGGPVYQSTGGTLIAQPQGAMPTTGAPMAPVMTPTRPQDINWGDPNNPADFVRADQALRGLGLLG